MKSLDKNSFAQEAEDEDEQFFDCPEDPEALQYAGLDRIHAICLPATPAPLPTPSGAPSSAVANSEAWRERLLLFPSSGEALAKLKEHRNARYKVFNSYPEAKQFASGSAAEQLTPRRPLKASPQGSSTAAAAAAVQETDSFRSVSQVQLNQLKTAINAGDLSAVSALIWNNPKHLVTDCDTPTLLMPRFRYNCLHQASLRNQSAIIKLLLAVLSGDEFWRRLNSETGSELRQSRRCRLLDLYLNSREMALGETPLHLAAKFCYSDCVRYLVARRECDISVRNNAGQTALEVAGSRVENSANLAETRLALCGQFVPLVADVVSGAVRVLPPVPAWGLQELLDQPQRLLVRAYAGPAEPDTARSLYERWRAPSRVLLFCRLSTTAAAAAAATSTTSPIGEENGENDEDVRPPRLPPASPVPGRPAGFEFQSPTNMRRTPTLDDDDVDEDFCNRQKGDTGDAVAAAVAEVTAAPLLDYDKGFEITGRALCRALGGVAWHERWEFFGGDFADLATEEGLSRLNQLLSDAYERMDSELGSACAASENNAPGTAAANADPWTDYREVDVSQDEDTEASWHSLTNLDADVEAVGNACHSNDNENQNLSDSFLEKVARWAIADGGSTGMATAASRPSPLRPAPLASTTAGSHARDTAQRQFRSPPPPRSKQQQQKGQPDLASQPPRMSTPRQRRPAPSDRRQLNSSPFDFVGTNPTAGGKDGGGGGWFSSPGRSRNPPLPVDLQVLRAISPAASASASAIDQSRYPSLARWRRSFGAVQSGNASSEDVSRLLLQLPASPLPSPLASPLASPMASPATAACASPSLRRLAAATAGATPRRRLVKPTTASMAADGKSFEQDF